MNNIKQLAEDIQKTSQIAHTNLEDVNPAVRAGWGATIENAKVRLKDLEQKYSQLIAKNSAAIFLTGNAEKVAEFAKLIRDEGEGFVVDAQALYNRLAHQVVVTLPQDRGSEWGVAQVYRLHTTIQEVMHEVGITELPMPDRTEAPFVKGYDQVLTHVRKIVRGACGDLLNKLYVERELVRQALEIRYTGVMVQVIVVNAQDGDIYDLGRMFGLGTHTVELADDTEVNDDFMRSVFEEATKKLAREKKLPKLEEPKEDRQEKKASSKKTEGKTKKAKGTQEEPAATNETEDKTDKE